jgi:endonuclease-3
MTKKQRAALCVAALKKAYPDALCSLEYTDPLQLLIATRLSAQCTDARVNQVTPALFAAYPTLDAFCNAKVEDVETYIHSCGFFRAKARDIVGMAQKLRDEFGGVVPDTVEALTTLPGVGRKTANLIVGDIYHKPAVVADTHLIRITNLLGLVDTKDPKKVEFELRALLDPAESNDFCHRCVLHGRAVCIARRPQCAACCMKPYCKSAV